jgi:phage-related protein
MSKFTVEFYEKGNNIPVKDFLDSLDNKMKAKLSMEIKLLEEKGTALRMPYSEHLKDGIFELRAKVGTDISRVLYFFYYEGRIILTHGFIKKTQKTPPSEIEKAKRYRKDFWERYGK